METSGDSHFAAVHAATGVDGCAGGWIAVTVGQPAGLAGAPGIDGVSGAPEILAGTGGPSLLPTLPAPRPGGAAPHFTVRVAVAVTLDGLPLAGVTGIDMPLGLVGSGWRDADILARRALGRRGVTVFAIPPRPVWEQSTYTEASRVCRDLTGNGLSVQAWGLRRKIAEADRFRRGAPFPLYEVHPELSFAALAGAPLRESKHTRAGRATRRELLARAGIALPASVGGAAEDDLLDAAAVAWSARRIAAGHTTVLASPGQRADDGTEIAIRC